MEKGEGGIPEKSIRGSKERVAEERRQEKVEVNH